MLRNLHQNETDDSSEAKMPSHCLSHALQVEGRCGLLDPAREREKREKKGKSPAAPPCIRKPEIGSKLLPAPRHDQACFPEACFPTGHTSPTCPTCTFHQMRGILAWWSRCPGSEWSCSWQRGRAARAAGDIHFNLLITANECALPPLAWGVWLIMGCPTANSSIPGLIF